MSKKTSKISILHLIKLILRSLLFVTVLVFDILDRTEVLTQNAILPIIVWIFFFVEMLLRFFPSKLESMGSQKQFARNYEPKGENIKPTNQSWKVTALVAVIWLALNAVIGTLYYCGIIDRAILILIAIFYSVCDIICILFFCPFQTWFMKNRCCGTCRIYNWDFLMMCTPLIFIDSWYTRSLTLLAAVLFIKWEVTAFLHPERFCTDANHALSCAECEEKLCHHKTQLLNFWKKEHIFK